MMRIKYGKSILARFFVKGGCKPSDFSVRYYSAQNDEIFNRRMKNNHRRIFGHLDSDNYYDYLRKEVADRLVDRLDDVARDFPRALDIGCHKGYVFDAINSRNEMVEIGERGVGGITQLVQCDAVDFGDLLSKKQPIETDNVVSTEFVISDEENLGFEDESFDLVFSSCSMHWVNDIPKLLKNVKRVLRPDGVFLCSLFGGSTLEELRQCFYLAEQDRKGGISPHASPMVRPSDAASLMGSAGFTLPTIDVDTIKVGYPDVFVLMEHLEAMGEGGSSFQRRLNTGRDTFLAMAALYQELHKSDDDDGIIATFQTVSMIGWKPHESQPKPLKRGTALQSMKDISGLRIDHSP